MDRGPLDMLVQIVHAGKTDAVLPEQPWPERACHVTSENGWATTTTLLHFAATLDNVLNSSREGQAWILLWDMASIHASADTLAAKRASRRTVLPPVTKHFVLAALRSGRLPKLQELHPGASERHSCLLCHRRLVRRLGQEQGMVAPRTSATRTRSGARDGVNCAHRATPNSARPLKRPTSCTPLARCSRDRSSQSPLLRTPWNGLWQRRQTTKMTRPCQTHRSSPG